MTKVKRTPNAKKRADLINLSRDFDKKRLEVGWFKNIRYDDDDKTPVAAVAARNEFGDVTSGIPPRPFMRPAVKDNKDKWSLILKNGAKKILNGSATVNQTLNSVGVIATGDVQRAITDVYSPPLSPKTIAARLKKRADGKTIGSLTKPLVDEGRLLESATYIVRDDAPGQ